MKFTIGNRRKPTTENIYVYISKLSYTAPLQKKRRKEATYCVIE